MYVNFRLQAPFTVLKMPEDRKIIANWNLVLLKCNKQYLKILQNHVIFSLKDPSVSEPSESCISFDRYQRFHRENDTFMNLQYYDAYIEDVLQENKKALHTLMPDCIFRFSVMQYFSHHLFWFIYSGFQSYSISLTTVCSGLFFQVFSHAVFLSPFVLPYFFRFSVMQYFSHRLFWQNEKGSIVVGDLECNFTSEITVEPVSVFTVTHPSLHPYPGNY